MMYSPNSEQSGLGWFVRDAQMIVGKFRGDASAGRALKETDLKQIRLVDIFDRVDFFAEHRGNRIDADGPAVEIVR